MSFSIKEWVRLETVEICKTAYGLASDLEGNLRNSDGNLFKWAIRDSKPQESWVFAITIAMGLASLVKQPPEEIAQVIADRLNHLSKPSWQFECAGAYINAYFVPEKVEDYFEDKEQPDWELLKQLNHGAYGYYRLEMIQKALEAKGVKVERASSVELDLKNHPLHKLFNFPELSPEGTEAGIKDWESWLESIGKMTALGDLRGLAPEIETELLIFIKACLKR